VYVSNGYELCSGILFTRVLTLTPLISVIMADCYVCEPHCQLFFEGYRPPGCWEETRSLYVFSRILHCLNQPLFPLCNKVLEASVCAWVVEIELPCFYSGILFMALSSSWGYKLKDCGVFKGAWLSVLPRFYLFTCDCFSVVNYFRR
jgi:hypothetical protein